MLPVASSEGGNLHTENQPLWEPGSAPVAVVMISLNEAHNMEAVLQNVRGWAQEVWLVDSYSSDGTVDIALRYGVNVVQRRFRGFGDQWNFALRELPITAPWTMKLDPDERLTDSLKMTVAREVTRGEATAIALCRRLWFMGKPLPVKHYLVRVWKTGSCRFSDVLVNEHPIVDGPVRRISGYLDHHDSPDLHHWVDKQNRYSTAEALMHVRGDSLSVPPSLLGDRLERRVWFKKHFMRFPARYVLTWVINLIRVRFWRSGRAGFTWARLRVWTRRMKEDKVREMRSTGRLIQIPDERLGAPHPHARQAEPENGGGRFDGFTL
jgi:glycosyltransferase involved in cell wall biosynthesis